MLMRAALTKWIRRWWIDSVGRGGGGGNELSIAIREIYRERESEGKWRRENSARDIFLNNGYYLGKLHIHPPLFLVFHPSSFFVILQNLFVNFPIF